MLQRERVELLFAAPIATLQRQEPGVVVRLEDGRSLHADLVIGADGARSKVRESADIESKKWTYGQSALVTHLRPEKAHCNTAWQRFLSKGPLGMLPLHDGRISVVWSTTDEQAQWAMQATDEALAEALTAASDHVLGSLAAAGAAVA